MNNSDIMNSKFYNKLHAQKDDLHKQLEEIKNRIADDLKENCFWHIAKLSTDANGILEKIIQLDNLIDAFDYEFYRE